MTEQTIIGAGGSKSSTSSVESQNTLRSKSYASIVDMLGAGPWEEFSSGIDLRRVFCDKVPVQNTDGTKNFSNFNVDYRQGNINQAYMPIAPTTESITTVNTKLYFNNPIERSISGSDIDIIRVSVLTPTLQRIDKESGSTYGTSVQYKIEYNSSDNTTFRDITAETGQFVQNELDPATAHGGYSKYLIYYTIYPSRVNGAVYQPSVLKQYSKKNSENWELSNTQSVTEDQVNHWYESNVSPTDMWQYKVEASNGATVTINKIVGQDTIYSGVFTLAGKCTSNYERQISFRPTGVAPYIVRVTRLTEDSTSQYLTNDLYFYSLSAAQEEKYTYPGCVLVGWQIDASQFSTIPTRSYLCKMLQVKIPDNYDPIARTYNGVWLGGFKTAWTDNPAWCYYDLLTNPYHGLGNRISEDMVDKWALYSIAQYCDALVPNGHGGLEPRFTCNLILTSRQEAYKVLQDFTTIFNGITYWGLGTVIPVQDSPKDPVYSFTNANVIDGTFIYKGSSRSTRYNAAVVTYTDKKNHYEQGTTYVDDPGLIISDGFVNSTNITAFGCSSEGQARRYGRWALYTNRYETDTITFNTGAEGGIPRPGDIIKVSDKLKTKDRRGGRVVSCSGVTLVLDNPIAFASGVVYSVSTISTDGVVQKGTFTSSTLTDTVTLDAPFPKDVAKDSIFTISDSSIQEAPYKTICVTDNSDGTYTISGVLHNISKWNYIEKDDPLTSVSVVTPAAQNTSSVVIKTDAVSVGNAWENNLHISWVAAPFAKSYTVTVTADDGRVWNYSTTNTEITITNVSNATYTGVVQTLSLQGVLSSGVGASVVVGDIPVIISKVTGVSYASTPDGTATLSWDKLSDTGLAGYEVRLSDSGWGDSSYLFHGMATSFSVAPKLGSTTFFVRAYIYKGNFSAESATVTVTHLANAAPVWQEPSWVDVNTITLKWIGNNTPFNCNTFHVEVFNPAGALINSINTNASAWTIPVTWTGNATATIYQINTLGWESGVASHPVSSTMPPAIPVTPEGLSAIGGTSSITVNWTAPTYTTGRGNRLTEVWAATNSGITPTIEDAGLVGTVAGSGNTFTLPVPFLNITKHFWIRFQTNDLFYSAFSGGVNGVPATVDKLAISQINDALITKIDLIDAPASTAGSVNARTQGFVGENLLGGTVDWEGWTDANTGGTLDGTYASLSVLKMTGAWGYRWFPVSLPAGTYTLSYYAKVLNGSPTNVGLFALGGGQGVVTPTSTWARYSVTFTIGAGGWSDRMRVESGNASDAQPLWICGMKLERGSIASSYQASSGDSVGVAVALTDLTTTVTQQGTSISSQSQQISSLQSGVSTAQSTANAAVTSAAQAQTTANAANSASSSNASSISAVSARLDSGDIRNSIASVTTTANAAASQAGNTNAALSATWQVRVDAAGKVAGLKAYSTGVTSGFVISADKVLIGDLTNLIGSGTGETADGWSAGCAADWGTDSYWISACGVSSRYAMTFANRDSIYGNAIPVRAGDQFAFSADTVPGGGAVPNTYSFSLGFVGYGVDGGIVGWWGAATRPAGTVGYAHIAGSMAIPGGCAFVRIWAQIDCPGGTNLAGVAGGEIHTTNLACRRMNGAELIVDGAITTNKLTAAAVTADKISTWQMQVGQFISSSNYVPGTSGWKINSDGAAEFGAASIRGQLTASQINTTGLFVGTAFTNAVTGIAGGTSPYVFTLSNYSAVFPADANGNVTSTTGNTTVVNVMQGTLDVTSNASISYTNVGCGVSQSGTTFTITGFSADSGYVAFTARIYDSVAGYVYMYKTYSWSKAKAGTAGINGTNGTSGSPGLRGIAYLTKQVTYATAASITSAICSATLPDGTPQLGDVVSFFNPNASPPWSTSRIYTASGWSSVALFVDGNAVVKGTLSAAVIATGEVNVFSASSGIVGIGKTGPYGSKGASPLAVCRTNTDVPSLHVGEYYSGSGATYWLADFVTGGKYGLRVQPMLDRTFQSDAVGIRIDGNGTVGLLVSGVSTNTNGTENTYSGKWYTACAQFNNRNSGTTRTTYIQYATASYAVYAPSGSGKGNFVDGVGAFTGIHIVGCNYLPEQGDIMIDVELLSNHDISNNQTRVDASSRTKQKGAIGIYNDEAMFDSSWDNAEKPEYALHVNAIGDGMINVTGEGGDIEIGDYIITSSTRGKGMKQEDDLLHNYTVARSRQNVSFKSEDEVKQIACVYVCG